MNLPWQPTVWTVCSLSWTEFDCDMSFAMDYVRQGGVAYRPKTFFPFWPMYNLLVPSRNAGNEGNRCVTNGWRHGISFFQWKPTWALPPSYTHRLGVTENISQRSHRFRLTIPLDQQGRVKIKECATGTVFMRQQPIYSHIKWCW